MPFDGSGNFSRLYSWQSDRDNGIRILASRMDQEFDNIAGGMNVVFFRNGLVPMSGNLNLGQNSIIGMASGSVGALSQRFADDPNTGQFLDGYGKLALVGGGTKALTVANGATSILNRADLASARITGDLNATSGATGPAAEVAYVPGLNTAYLTGYNRTTAAYVPLAVAGQYFSVNTNGSERARFTDTAANIYQNMGIAGTLNATGAITQNGAQVYHTGNFNPANYAPIANPNHTGLVTIAPTADALGLRIGASSNGTGFIQLGTNATGSNNFHFGTGTDGTLRFYSNNYGQGTERFRIQADGNAAISGTTLAVGGNNVWHAGNFNPANYLLTTAQAADSAKLAGITPMLGNNAQQGTAWVPIVKADGVMEVGTYLDFHAIGQPASDFDYRLTASVGLLTASGALNVGGALTQNNQQVYHTGNFTPANYAALNSAPTFTGAVQSPRYTNTGPLGANPTNARNHFQSYNAGSAAIAGGWIAAAFGDASGARVVIGQGDGTAILGAHNGDLGAWADLYINKGGGTTYIGPAYRADNGTQRGMMAYQDTAGRSAAMSRGTANPSGGSDGDMYFQYT